MTSSEKARTMVCPTISGKSANLSTGVQSIQRAIALLRLVASRNQQGVRLSALARNVGLHPATAHRILSLLSREGLLTHDPHSKRYNLGFELYSLGMAAHRFQIRDQFRPVLERIASMTGDTTYLVLPCGSDALCIDRILGSFPIKVMTFEIGERRPLGIGAASLALLAAFTDEEITAILEANRTRYPQYRNRSVRELWTFVKKTRKTGYGLSEGNVDPNTAAVGIAILDQKGRPMAGISVGAILKRMGPRRRADIVKLIRSEINGLALSSR